MSQAADARISRQLSRLASHRGHVAVAEYGRRLRDVAQLIAAHQAKGGTGPGRRVDLDAVDRAALVMLTGHFQGFAGDLFVEAWDIRYPGASGAALLDRLRFSNPWPDDIDKVFAILGIATLTKTCEPRPGASSAGPPRNLISPHFGRERTKHQVRQVIAEMVGLRNASVHGGTAVAVKMSDVTSYLTDTVSLAIAMSKAL